MPDLGRLAALEFLPLPTRPMVPLTVNTNASGTASFTNLRIDRSGVFTLRFSSGTLQAVISNSITIP